MILYAKTDIYRCGETHKFVSDPAKMKSGLFLFLAGDAVDETAQSRYSLSLEVTPDFVCENPDQVDRDSGDKTPDKSWTHNDIRAWLRTQGITGAAAEGRKDDLLARVALVQGLQSEGVVPDEMTRRILAQIGNAAANTETGEGSEGDADTVTPETGEANTAKPGGIFGAFRQ